MVRYNKTNIAERSNDMLSTLQLTERFEDRREIKNIMGKYVTSCLLCREDTIVDR